VSKQLNAYRSDISVREYDYKLYVDPQYGEELNPSVINYAVLSSKWSIEDVHEDHTIKIIHKQTQDSISLSFNSFKDKLAFAANIYSSAPVKQVGKGHDLESIANLHILYPDKSSYEVKVASVLNMFLKLLIEGRNIFKKSDYDRSIKKLKAIFRKGLLAN
jgi:hypothetical protein